MWNFLTSPSLCIPFYMSFSFKKKEDGHWWWALPQAWWYPQAIPTFGQSTVFMCPALGICPQSLEGPEFWGPRSSLHHSAFLSWPQKQISRFTWAPSSLALSRDTWALVKSKSFTMGVWGLRCIFLSSTLSTEPTVALRGQLFLKRKSLPMPQGSSVSCPILWNSSTTT